MNVTIEELLEQNTMLARNHLLLEQDFAECMEMLESVLVQACSHRDCPHSVEYLDSMALSAYADGIRYLAKKKRVTIVSESGRRVIGNVVGI